MCCSRLICMHASAPDLGQPLRVVAAGREGHGQRERAHALGRLDRDLLRDRAAHRDADQVEAVELQVVGERERVARHVGDLVVAVGHRGLADVAVVEDHGPETRPSTRRAGGSTRACRRPGRARRRAARPRHGSRSRAAVRLPLRSPCAKAYWLASQPWYARRPDAWGRGRDRSGARLRPRDRAPPGRTRLHRARHGRGRRGGRLHARRRSAASRCSSTCATPTPTARPPAQPASAARSRSG